jgi:HAD superfamily hydrolase (TIGR01509 family)
MTVEKHHYIFDFDGVLVDTMEAHFSCYKKALEEAGVPIDKAQFYRQAGMKGVEQIAYFAEKAGVQVDPEKVYARKREIWNGERPKSTKIECNIELLNVLRKAGHRVAIASGSSRPSILPVVSEFSIEVDAIVTSEDVERGKPFPDLFLCAARKLGVPPESCIVVEDSDVGIEAALAAGMKALRFFERSR